MTSKISCIFVRYVIIYFIPIFIYSCNNRVHLPAGDVGIIQVDIDRGTYIELSDIVDSFRFVPLQMTDDCIIGQINKVIFAYGNYYILDEELAKSLYVFDQEGNFKFKVGRLGRGPGEYVHLADFSINFKDETIEILAEASKILKFDMNGKFLSALKLEKPNFSEKFEIFDDGNYLVSRNNDRSNDKSGLLLLSPEGKVLWEGIDWTYPNPNINLSLRKQFSKTPSGITFNFGLVDTVYHLDNSLSLSKRVLDFKGRNLPHSLMMSFKEMRDMVTSIKQSPYVADIDRVTETDSLFYFYFICDNNAFSVYQSKQTQNIKLYMHNRFVDPFFSQFPIASIGDFQLIYPIDVADLLSYFEDLPLEMKSKFQNKSFWDMYQKLDFNDNPVLMIAHFKNF